MVRRGVIILCALFLVTGCADSSDWTDSQRLAQRRVQSNPDQEKIADPACVVEGLGVRVNNPDYQPDVTVVEGQAAPENSVHANLSLPIYLDANELDTSQTADEIRDRYIVPSDDLVRDRDEIAQFYHQNLRDAGLVYKRPNVELIYNYRSCADYPGIMSYSFRFTNPDMPPDTLEYLEAVTIVRIEPLKSNRVAVSLSRSTPEKIARTLEKQNEKIVLRRNAKVVTKRSSVSGTSGYSHTTHYVTFELEDGSRVEFSVSGQQSGLLVEGDEGVLVSKGRGFQEFERGSY